MITIISNREQLGSVLNELGLTGIGVEVGCAHGGYARMVLRDWRGEKYFMVDPWARQDAGVYREKTDHVDFDDYFIQCSKLAAEDKRVHLVRQMSVDAAEQFEDESLDFVFIDGNHSYEAVSDDLRAWWPKVKPGGLFCGHDHYTAFDSGHHCEVDRAVREWAAHKLLSYLLTDCTSWWLLKPGGDQVRALVREGKELTGAPIRTLSSATSTGPGEMTSNPIKLRIVTSLSPDPKQMARQKACIASWRATGCEVLAYQTAAEAATIGAARYEVSMRVVDGAEGWDGRFVPISRALHAAREEDSSGYVLLLNADCELECDREVLTALAREAGDGLCYLVRHETTTGIRMSHGIDGMLMAADAVDVMPDSEVLVFGRPHWDWVMPSLFLFKERPVCTPAWRLIAHEPHPNRPSAADHAKTGREAHRLLGSGPSYEYFDTRARHLGSRATPKTLSPSLPELQQQEQDFAAHRALRGYF